MDSVSSATPSTNALSIFSRSIGSSRKRLKRRVAGPEVVERDAHPEGLQPPQAGHRGLAVGEEDAFGDLERQRVCLEPRSDEDGGDVVDEADIEQLTRREVHRDAEVEVGMRPLPHDGLRARLRQHPPTELDDQPGLLGERDELARGKEAARRVLPTHQRLEPAHLAGAQPNRRLVVHHELVRAQCTAELGFEVQPRQGRVVHLGLVDPHTGLALALGLVHGHVGVAYELLGAVAGPVERDSHARGDQQLLGRDRERQREHRKQAFGQRGHLVLALDVLQQDGELVTTETCRGVAGPELVLDPLRRRDEQLVTGGVAEAVVDRLEPVEVQHDDRDRPSIPGLARRARGPRDRRRAPDSRAG